MIKYIATHCTPADTPTRGMSIRGISSELEVDNITLACNSGRQWRAFILRATALFHQDCPVTVCYLQVVFVT